MPKLCSRRRKEADFSALLRHSPPPYVGGYDFSNTLSVSNSHRPHSSWIGERGRANSLLDPERLDMVVMKEVVEAVAMGPVQHRTLVEPPRLVGIRRRS